MPVPACRCEAHSDGLVQTVLHLTERRSTDTNLPARRRFLSAAAVGVGSVLLSGAPAIVSAATRADLPETRSLRLYNDHFPHEGILDVVYCIKGMPIDESHAKINRLMRDRRVAGQTGICQMDLRLFDDLFRVQQMFGTGEPLHVLSGYRTPATNAKLRARSRNVAKFSYHMQGRAADIYIPGVRTRDLQAAALSLKSGGVGYYHRSGFVHMDTGPFRRWDR